MLCYHLLSTLLVIFGVLVHKVMATSPRVWVIFPLQVGVTEEKPSDAKPLEAEKPITKLTELWNGWGPEFEVVWTKGFVVVQVQAHCFRLG